MPRMGFELVILQFDTRVINNYSFLLRSEVPTGLTMKNPAFCDTT
jgi:hypothetical protein